MIAATLADHKRHFQVLLWIQQLDAVRFFLLIRNRDNVGAKRLQDGRQNFELALGADVTTKNFVIAHSDVEIIEDRSAGDWYLHPGVLADLLA